MSDPYEILGVTRNSTDEEIKNAYRDAARRYQESDYSNSPLGNVAEKKMRELDDAYDAIINERRSASGGGYNYGYSTHSQNSYTPPTYAEIRERIKRNDLDGAQVLLNNIPQGQRIAEWFYLQGMIQQKKGWANAAYENYERAYQADPSNPEYTRAYQGMNNQRTGGYRTSRSGGSDSSSCGFCNFCQGLICADCCCECMGGDLIPCC